MKKLIAMFAVLSMAIIISLAVGSDKSRDSIAKNEKKEGSDKRLVHCGECEGDKDHDHEDSDGEDSKALIAHCGECEGDKDHDHEDSDKESLA